MSFKFPKFYGQRFNIEAATILLTVAGSRSYGTETALSDTDYKGLLVPPKREILSPFANFEQVQWKGDGFTGRVSEIAGKVERDEEGVIYGLPKFIKLAATCNPNIIETLYTEEKDLVVLTAEGKLLRNNRDLFLSQNAANTFAGYALAQLKRIKTHKKWIDGAPDSKKDPKAYGQYMNWKKNRNPARAAIEEKYGYDSKHAMHLVRLLRMGHEILTEGRVEVRRSDRDELLEIRNGAWSYEKLNEWAESKKAELFEVVDKGLAVVPEKPDQDKIIEIVEEIYSLAWK